jgi:hypothetical protein
MSAIANGAHVSLFNLSNQAYNAQEGICYGINDNGRYIIQLNSKKRILVKRENIRVIPRSSLDVVNSFAVDPKTVKESALNIPSNSSWARGLDQVAAGEWFIDCYRMRVDDEYAWGGEVRPGSLYDPRHSKKTIATDFLVFCHMALFVRAVPDVWDWVSCLDKFGNLLNYAFEKSDAGDKYGGENIFSAFTGGRSLRATAEIIYGSSAGGQYDNPSVDTQAIMAEFERLDSLVGRKMKWNSKNILFENVGGFQVWNRLLGKLE